MSRITSKGQVTIPIGIRQELGLLPETEVEFEVDGTAVRVFRARHAASGRGQSVVRRLRGRGSVRLSTEEILSLTREA